MAYASRFNALAEDWCVALGEWAYSHRKLNRAQFDAPYKTQLFQFLVAIRGGRNRSPSVTFGWRIEHREHSRASISITTPKAIQDRPEHWGNFTQGKRKAAVLGLLGKQDELTNQRGTDCLDALHIDEDGPPQLRRTRQNSSKLATNGVHVRRIDEGRAIESHH